MQQGIELRTLVLVLIGMAVAFAGTSALSHWSHARRLESGWQHYREGLALADAGDYREAAVRFRAALATRRDSTDYRLALAQSLIGQKQHSEAMLRLNEVLRADPARAYPNLLLARIATSEGRMDDAANYYHRAVFGYWRREPGVRRRETRWELVSFLAAHQRRKEMVAELLAMAAEAPADPLLLKRIGALLVKHSSPSEAAGIFASVNREAPNDAEGWAGSGQAQMALGNYRQAQRAFRRAAALAPGDPGARAGLELSNEVLSLDPTLTGLRTAERQRRARVILRRSLAALDRCEGERILPPETMEVLAKARRAASAPAHAEFEDDLDLAQQVWEHRADYCGAPYEDEALSRALARIER